MNISKEVFESLLSVPLEYLSRSGLVDHVVILCLIFWGTTKLFPTASVLFYIAPSSARGFQFLCILTNTYFLFVLWPFFFLLPFNYHHSSGCEVVSHCGLEFHFPDD